MITGPSGVGKGTLIRGLLERVPELELSVSATTRAPRPGERTGVDYHFLGPEEFERPRRATATSSSTPPTRAGATGRCAPSSSAGCAAASRWCSRSRSRAPARSARRCPRRSRCSSPRPPARRCATRLVGRGTDTPEQVDARLRTAERELDAQPEFGHVVVNDRLERRADELAEIVRGEVGASPRPSRAGGGGAPRGIARAVLGRARLPPLQVCTSPLTLVGNQPAKGQP